MPPNCAAAPLRPLRAGPVRAAGPARVVTAQRLLTDAVLRTRLAAGATLAPVQLRSLGAETLRCSRPRASRPCSRPALAHPQAAAQAAPLRQPGVGKDQVRLAAVLRAQPARPPTRAPNPFHLQSSVPSSAARGAHRGPTGY